MKNDLYRAVTDSIIKDLEAGTALWVKPWKDGNAGILPVNAATKRPYSGVNIPILWHAQMKRGYPTAEWLTYKQALPLDAHVRKGETGTTVVFTKRVTITDSDNEDKIIPILRTYHVFNVAQVDGLPLEPLAPPLSQEERDDKAIRFIQATKADIRHGGDMAAYIPKHDYITLPPLIAFESYEHYLATAFHELTHWTAAEHRLHRDLNHRFSTRSYAAEELIAELGAAFLCARLEVKGQLRHAEYIQNWLQLLRDDDRAIFTAASKASQAADYLLSFSEQVEDDDVE